MPTGHYQRRKYIKPDFSSLPVLSETEKAYAAGIIDGEGSIMMIHHRPRPEAGHKWEYWVLRVSIANCDKRIIDWLSERFGGGYSLARSLNPKCRDVYSWRVDSKKAQPILTTVLPYLVLKREQADLALKMIATHCLVGCKGHKRETIDIRRSLAAQMKQLNSRGKEIPRWPSFQN